jgi:peptidyl-prolyl cis-trans isomerase B (cyclophilin B)
MKKSLVLLVALVLTATLTPAATAAEKPVSVPGCKKSVATGRTPATVKQPKAVAKKFAKTITLTTNCGPIVITLNPKAPQTITNMAALANAGYFNKSLCHRLVTSGILVLQCGDPTATGGGSPTGWTKYADENLPAPGLNGYPTGTVAMANSGPGTNGSQFFLVYGASQLENKYTIWGTITKGLDLLQKIGEVGAFKMQGDQAYYAGDGYPIQMVEIVKASAK